MSSIDSAIILIISLLTARGVWTGFARQLSFIAALILAFIVAGRFYLFFAGFLKSFIQTPQLAFLVTYMLLFCAVYLLVIYLGFGLRKFLKISMLGGLDRVMGGVFGMGKGMFILILLFMVLAGVMSNSATFLKKSYFYPFLNGGSLLVMSFINDPALRAGFRPKVPAIPAIYAGSADRLAARPRSPDPKYQRALDEIRYQLAREVGDRPNR
ncbi:MAG: CvpA family protein [Desulfurivibrionaceae bacterium]|nr:CvpA family protein [Desulfobulbales bacterium]MDT8335854.1 CvpA family protein [Desulfurivibrionaceae bacterium]